MKKLLIVCALCLSAFGLSISAQPQPMERQQADEAEVKPAPDSFEARYEGGLFGFSSREKGTLKFDDANQRIVFYDDENKELFSLNYDSMLVVAPSSKKVQSGTGRTLGAIPIPGAGLGGSFLKKKKNYLVIQFEDPDVDVRGTVSFLVDTTELLISVVHTLGDKAELSQRGDAFFRPRTTD